MSKLLDGLKQALLGDPDNSNGAAPALHVTVKCDKCGEVIRVRVDKANDLLSDLAGDDETADQPPMGYTLRKEAVGRRCQNLVHFAMQFDEHRRVTGRQIKGGEFVECKECD